MWFKLCSVPAKPNVAVTEVAVEPTVSTQLPRPVHAPDQKEKMLPVPGVSVSVTWVFGGKPAEHAVGQLIPAGLLVTVPLPDTVTVSPVPALNVGVTVTAAVIVTMHVLVPVQPPLQPLEK